MIATYCIFIYKRDRRCKGGERFVGKYDFGRTRLESVQNEVRELQQQLYRERDGFRLEVKESC